MPKATAKQYAGAWTVYANGRPVAYNLTSGEKKSVKRQAERRVKRFNKEYQHGKR